MSAQSVLKTRREFLSIIYQRNSEPQVLAAPVHLYHSVTWKQLGEM